MRDVRLTSPSRLAAYRPACMIVMLLLTAVASLDAADTSAGLVAPDAIVKKLADGFVEAPSSVWLTLVGRCR